MCLPACPTYQVTGNEGNSPRGRLYIINDYLQSFAKSSGLQAPGSGDLDHNQKSAQDSSKDARSPEPGARSLDSKSIDYLDNCLTCYGCESVCPSGVEYGSILDHAREELKQTQYDKGLFGLLRKFVFLVLLPNRVYLNLLRVFMKLFGFILPRSTKLGRLKPRFDSDYQLIETDHYFRSDVVITDLRDDERTLSLPLGCVMDTVYNKVHWDTIKVLNRFGYHVYIPDSACCGALAHHSGESWIGKWQLADTIEVLRCKKYPVVMNSAGCGAHMKSYQEILYGDGVGEEGRDFVAHLASQEDEIQVVDLIEVLKDAPYNPMKSSFIDSHHLESFAIKELKLKPESKIQVTYHPACHLNHQQHLSDNYLDLLKQIPQLEIKELYEADLCCGSAGFYNLIKTDMADAIGERKAEYIQDTGVNIVLTANPGCMSQIQAHLPDDYVVLHPVSLLRGYLSNN